MGRLVYDFRNMTPTYDTNYYRGYLIQQIDKVFASQLIADQIKYFASSVRVNFKSMADSGLAGTTMINESAVVNFDLSHWFFDAKTKNFFADQTVDMGPVGEPGVYNPETDVTLSSAAVHEADHIPYDIVNHTAAFIDTAQYMNTTEYAKYSLSEILFEKINDLQRNKLGISGGDPSAQFKIMHVNASNERTGWAPAADAMLTNDNALDYVGMDPVTVIQHLKKPGDDIYKYLPDFLTSSKFSDQFSSHNTDLGYNGISSWVDGGFLQIFNNIWADLKSLYHSLSIGRQSTPAGVQDIYSTNDGSSQIVVNYDTQGSIVSFVSLEDNVATASTEPLEVPSLISSFLTYDKTFNFLPTTSSEDGGIGFVQPTSREAPLFVYKLTGPNPDNANFSLDPFSGVIAINDPNHTFDYKLDHVIHVTATALNLNVEADLSIKFTPKNYDAMAASVHSTSSTYTYVFGVHYAFNGANDQGPVINTIAYSPSTTYKIYGDLASYARIKLTPDAYGHNQVHLLLQDNVFADDFNEKTITGGIDIIQGNATTHLPIVELFTPYSQPNGIMFSADAIHELSPHNYGPYDSRDLGGFYLNDLGYVGNDRRSHIHITLAGDDIFSYGFNNQVGYDSVTPHLYIRGGVTLLPDHTYTTLISAWDDNLPNQPHATSLFSVHVGDGILV